MIDLVRDPAFPPVDNLRMPEDLYWVLESPPLAGMRHPRSFQSQHWVTLHEHGIRSLVALTADASFDPTPVRLARAVALEDLYGGALPTRPQEERKAVIEAAEAVQKELKQGNGVAVHCEGGTGRTGAVIGRALVNLGIPRDEVISYLNDLHLRRGRGGWPESKWQLTLLEDEGTDQGPEQTMN